MRLIDADRLLSDQMRSKYYHLPNGDTAIPIIDIEHSPTVGGWISVKDRLPEESGNVLVCVKLNYAAGARYAQMCHYSAYKKQFGCFDTSENSGIPKYGVVTHWMQMPEPPQEGDA